MFMKMVENNTIIVIFLKKLMFYWKELIIKWIDS
jgi:hypothetical protein